MAFPLLMGIGAAASIFQGVSGMVQSKKAKDALNDFDRQELTNVYENIGVSRVGSDLMRDENARVSGMSVDAARSGGIRGIMSTLPKIQAQNNAQNMEARKYLDDQVIERDYAIAGDNQRIQSMQEQRDNADLAGLGQQLQTGRQNMWSGIRGLASAGMGAASGGLGGATPQVSSLGGGLQSMGAIPMAQPQITAPLMNTNGF